MRDFPEVEVVNGRLVFVIALGWTDAVRRHCDCSICTRGNRSPSWAMWEPEVECVWRGGRQERKRSGDAGHAAA